MAILLRHRDPIGRLPRLETERIERLLGEPTFDLAVRSSKGVYCPVPVLYPNAHAFLHNGELFPQLAGGTGFSSLSDLISEMTAGGKLQTLPFTKTGVTGVVGTAGHTWLSAGSPGAGGAGGTTGTGVKRASGEAGTIIFTNPGGADTLHFIGGTFMGSVGTQILVLYDRIWDMTHTMTVDPRSNDAANVPNRYQDATAAGVVITGEVTTVLPASSPTVTFLYVDQSGTNTTSPANTIRSSAAAGSSPFPLGQWFATIDPADQGVRAIQNNASAIDLSAAMASGVVTWILAKPLAFIPIPTANVPVPVDGVNSSINLVQIVANAALAFFELKGATGATNWFGNIIACAG